jgi:TetR/AcrR family transcriptional regulator, transcriptional repressor for nem operon
MRVSQEEKARTHARILASASRRMREDGVAGAGLSEVMRDAGMTNGGFYRHFATREAMLASALEAAFDSFLTPLETAAAAGDPAEALAQFRAIYLSPGHVANPGLGCPLPAVGSEIGHAGEELRQAFAAGLNRLVAQFAAGLAGDPAARRAAAIREIAMLAGAVMLARATNPAMAEQIVTACSEAS